MDAQRGLFIALEGGEGAGKTTLVAKLADRLRNGRREVVTVREPGGTPFGEAARTLLMMEDLSPWAETLTFLAARAQLVEKVIRPSLEAGVLVICDRYAASTLAYQGYGRGLDLTVLKVANKLATGGLEPDLTILLDIDPETGLARKDGEEGVVRTGSETLAFHLRVRQGFTGLATAAVPGTWATLDATAPADQVVEEAWRILAPRLSHHSVRRLD